MSALASQGAEEIAALSMRFAEHKRERYDEELVAQIVTDVQDPAAAILCTACGGK